MPGGEFRSTTEPKIGRFTANTFKHRQLKYSALGGIAIFEGDIALGTVAQIEVVSNQPSIRVLVPEGMVVVGQQYRWPGRQIPYRIDPALSDPDRVTKAIAHWQDRTRITFVPLTSDSLNQFPNRVLFTAQGGCWSNIGMQGGEQIVSLGEGCTMGNAIHEIGHTVGLWHEQSRHDRDTYVTINHQNIQPGTEHNFDQQLTDGDDVGDYDYGSIMHYSAAAFSKNGQPTIVAKNGAPIGQREALSAGDIAALNAIYP